MNAPHTKRSAAPIDLSNLSLVPIDDPSALARDHQRASRMPDRLPILAELLGAPLADIQAFGALPDLDTDPLRVMHGKKSPVAELASRVEELVPMIDSFRTPTRKRDAWWRRFTGEALERDMMFDKACAQLEGVALQCRALASKVQLMRAALLGERELLAVHSDWLDAVVKLGLQALSDAHVQQRAAPVFAALPDYWARFSRRVDNLNVLHHSMLLSMQQFKLVDAQGQAVLDRHNEVLTVLLPLWRQRMGFELFAKGMSDEPTGA